MENIQLEKQRRFEISCTKYNLWQISTCDISHSHMILKVGEGVVYKYCKTL
jgi:hypothetical protein